MFALWCACQVAPGCGRARGFILGQTVPCRLGPSKRNVAADETCSAKPHRARPNLGLAECLLGVKTFIESLSLGSGAALIAVLSALLAWPLCYVRPALVRWFLAAAVSLVLSSCIYWLPVWLGANSSEYSSWALLFICPWFLAGAVSAVLVIFIFDRCYAKPHA